MFILYFIFYMYNFFYIGPSTTINNDPKQTANNKLYHDHQREISAANIYQGFQGIFHYHSFDETFINDINYNCEYVGINC